MMIGSLANGNAPQSRPSFSDGKLTDEKSTLSETLRGGAVRLFSSNMVCADCGIFYKIEFSVQQFLRAKRKKLRSGKRFTAYGEYSAEKISTDYCGSVLRELNSSDHFHGVHDCRNPHQEKYQMHTRSNIFCICGLLMNLRQGKTLLFLLGANYGDNITSFQYRLRSNCIMSDCVCLVSRKI